MVSESIRSGSVLVNPHRLVTLPAGNLHLATVNCLFIYERKDSCSQECFFIFTYTCMHVVKALTLTQTLPPDPAHRETYVQCTACAYRDFSI